MKLLEPFQLFSISECQQLIDTASVLSDAGVYGHGVKPSVRNNRVFWYNLPLDLKNRLWELGSEFKPEFPWTWFQEPVQISKYSVGEFYDWHDDVIPGRTSRRSLTLTCSLTTAPGAEFQTRHRRYILEQGQAVFFPSTIEHRATAPSQGQRWAFTVWYMQPN